MENILATMRGYLQMDSEIDAAEFNSFYKTVMDFLQADFADLEADALVKMHAVTSIMGMNAADRSTRRDNDAKKFKKIAQKAKFWNDAIAYKLNKTHGMSQDEIDRASDTVFVAE